MVQAIQEVSTSPLFDSAYFDGLLEVPVELHCPAYGDVIQVEYQQDTPPDRHLCKLDVIENGFTFRRKDDHPFQVEIQSLTDEDDLHKTGWFFYPTFHSEITVARFVRRASVDSSPDKLAPATQQAWLLYGDDRLAITSFRAQAFANAIGKYALIKQESALKQQ